jgi:hypothetical protein
MRMSRSKNQRKNQHSERESGSESEESDESEESEEGEEKSESESEAKVMAKQRPTTRSRKQTRLQTKSATRKKKTTSKPKRVAAAKVDEMPSKRCRSTASVESIAEMDADAHRLKALQEQKLKLLVELEEGEVKQLEDRLASSKRQIEERESHGAAKGAPKQELPALLEVSELLLEQAEGDRRAAERSAIFHLLQQMHH